LKCAETKKTIHGLRGSALHYQAPAAGVSAQKVIETGKERPPSVLRGRDEE
jgi:hypothetical protein